MRPSTSTSLKNGYQSDDENVRYKINTGFNITNKHSPKIPKKEEKLKANDENNIRYKLPDTAIVKNKPTVKPKKPKIKVNFWSIKPTGSRLHNTDNKQKTNRRHTVSVPTADNIEKPKNSGKNVVKVRKRVSFLPSPLFLDNHIPMVTVPDDLTIHLNEEEANDLGEDLNAAIVNNKNNEFSKKRGRNSNIHTSPKSTNRKRSHNESEPRIHGNDNELEFFSKYVVQKLRRMETNQRIYSENLINTVLMLGQLGELNGKSKIAGA